MGLHCFERETRVRFARGMKIDNKSSARNSMKRLLILGRFAAGAASRAALVSFKNGVKITMGRKPYFDERGLFLRQFLLHLLRLRPIRKITCTGLPGEGAGSQALMIMNAINFARRSGLPYVHTPFTHIAHAERPMREWVTAWENLFNLGEGEAVWDGDRRGVINFCYAFPHLDLCLGRHGSEDEDARHFKSLIPEFRRKYYSNKSSRTNEVFKVAVHIRRGDVTSADSDYFTSNEIVLRTITAVKSILDGREIRHRICVYSEGVRADFADLSLPEVEFFLGTDAIRTIQELIEADVLIMARGCFSYYAGLISDGIKLLIPVPPALDQLPGWRWLSVSPLESWISCSENGSFDSAALERQLFPALQTKPANPVPTGWHEK